MQHISSLHLKTCVLAIVVLASIGVLHAAPDEARAEKTEAPAMVLRAGEDEVARVQVCWDAKNLHLEYRVFDTSPLQNGGTNAKLLFKTGDSVDLQIGLDADADPKRSTPIEGDIRLLMTRTNDGPVAVVYRYKVTGTQAPERFWSPVGEVTVDQVEQLKDVDLKIESIEGGYQLIASIPWRALAGKEYSPPDGKPLRGDVGVLFSDPDGQVTVERIYWSNKLTAVVADIPSEIRLHPDAWSEFSIAR